LDDDLCDLLKGLLLLVVEDLVSLRDALNLLVYVGIPRYALLLLESLHELVEVFGAALEDLLCARKNCDFGFDLTYNLLHLLVGGILAAKICSVLFEIVALHVLPTTSAGILGLLIIHQLFKRDLLSLDLPQLLVLSFLLL